MLPRCWVLFAVQATKNEPSSTLLLNRRPFWPTTLTLTIKQVMAEIELGNGLPDVRTCKETNESLKVRRQLRPPARCARLFPPAAAQPLSTSSPHTHTHSNPSSKTNAPKPYRPPALSCSTAATWRSTPTCRGGTRSTPTRGAWPVRLLPCFALFELLCRLLLAPCPCGLPLIPFAHPVLTSETHPIPQTQLQPQPRRRRLPHDQARPQGDARARARPRVCRRRAQGLARGRQHARARRRRARRGRQEGHLHAAVLLPRAQAAGGAGQVRYFTRPIVPIGPLGRKTRGVCRAEARFLCCFLWLFLPPIPDPSSFLVGAPYLIMCRVSKHGPFFSAPEHTHTRTNLLLADSAVSVRRVKSQLSTNDYIHATFL